MVTWPKCDFFKIMNYLSLNTNFAQIFVIYQYTRKKVAKTPKNTQNSSKYTQNYTQVYFIPEIQRKWYTEYPYLSCNIPYTRFKKPLYTVYPKTLADPDQGKTEESEYMAWETTQLSVSRFHLCTAIPNFAQKTSRIFRMKKVDSIIILGTGIPPKFEHKLRHR